MRMPFLHRVLTVIATLAVAATITSVAAGRFQQPSTWPDLDPAGALTFTTPYNLAFADLDGDGTKELLQYGANKLFGFRADRLGSPMLHFYYRSDTQPRKSDITRLIVGHFATSGREHDRDDVCAVLDSGDFVCGAPSPKADELWWWFTQPAFVAADEIPIVADFDGNGADDILVYAPLTGAIRLYTTGRGGAAWFSRSAHVSLDGLSPSDLRRKEFSAGEFGSDAGHADLVMHDPATGTVTRFDSVAPAQPDNLQFRRAFTTPAGTVGPHEHILAARLDSAGNRDSLVLRDASNGAIRVRRAARSDSGGLQTLSGIGLGPVANAGSGQLYLRELAKPDSETAAADALLLTSDGRMQRWDAQRSGTKVTYRSAYRKAIPRLDLGWHSVVTDRWYVVPCKVISPYATLPMNHAKAWWKNQFSLANPTGLARYYWEQTYGTLDISDMTYTKQVTVRRPADGAWNSPILNAACAKAAGLAGTHAKVLAYTNEPAFQSGPGWLSVSENPADFFIDPATKTGVRLAAIAHEMGHALSLDHAGSDILNVDNDTIIYGETWSVMGSDWAACATNSHGDCAPTGLNGYQRSVLFGGLPIDQNAVLEPDGKRHTVTITLAGLDRPEAGGGSGHGRGYLTARIRLPRGADPTCVAAWHTAGWPNAETDCALPNKFLMVEFRENNGWDRAHDASGVLIHKTLRSWGNNDPATLLMRAQHEMYQAGDEYTGDGITVRVLAIDTARSQATVSITY